MNFSIEKSLKILYPALLVYYSTYIIRVSALPNGCDPLLIQSPYLIIARVQCTPYTQPGAMVMMGCDIVPLLLE